jgi:hypothetical protein
MFMPELTMPAAEAAHLRDAYAQAQVILEYGSGGSTVIAASMADKTVFSVESDVEWLSEMSAYFAANSVTADLHLHHGNIGPTGDWGHPANDAEFRLWPNYPNSVWERADFVQPDVVLIDGRFRVACFLTVALRSTGPVTVLFDDYKDRKAYHAVEDIIQPKAMIGRMAHFELTPISLPKERLGWIVSRFLIPQ